mgnify:CR=1 FL=1
MTRHHTSLYDGEFYPATTTMLKQKLFDTQQTEYGVRITNLKRRFHDGDPTDSHESEPLTQNI